LEEVSLVVVEHRRKQRQQNATTNHGNIFRRHSASVDQGCRKWASLALEPAVDFPVQLNFGSPYSSSVTIFFDQDVPTATAVSPVVIQPQNKNKTSKRLLSSRSFSGRKYV